MTATEIGRRRAVDHRALGRAESILDDAVRVGAGDGVHGIELHAEAARKHGAYPVEIEQRLHELGIVGDRIDHLHDHGARMVGADGAQVDVGCVDGEVAVDDLGAREHRVGDLLGRRATIADIVLDAKIAIRPARVVARRQHQAAEGVVMANDMARSGGRQQAVLPDQHGAEAVGRGDANNALDGDVVEVAAVAADHQRLALVALERVEDRLHEVLDIVGTAELAHPLAQAGGAGLLVGERGGVNRLYRHRVQAPVVTRRGRRISRRSLPTRRRISCPGAASCATPLGAHRAQSCAGWLR